MSHTPGPWTVGASGITVFAREGAHKIAAPGTDVPIAERQHNARLIAAAPDLLAACKEAMVAAKYGPTAAWLADVHRLLQTAIAKAEGRSDAAPR